jgi:hypothetical protein
MAKEAIEDTGKAKGEDKAKGRSMPAGDGPVEFRLLKKVALPEAGRVVRENWVGKVMGRRVRVFRGAQEHTIPDVVKAELQKSGIEIGVITWEELGLKPPTPVPAFRNLTQEQLLAAAMQLTKAAETAPTV